MKSAHNSVLKDPTRKVILIILGDLPSKDLDADIRLFLKNQTFIKTGDKNFWDKLRYALPDVREKSLTSYSLHGRTDSSNYINQQSLGRPIHKPLPPIPPSLLLHHQQLQLAGGPQIPSINNTLIYSSNYYMPIGNRPLPKNPSVINV